MPQDHNFTSKEESTVHYFQHQEKISNQDPWSPCLQCMINFITANLVLHGIRRKLDNSIISPVETKIGISKVVSDA